MMARLFEEPKRFKPSKRILVVDDEPYIVMLLRNRLEPAGYEIEEAFSGGDALERLENRAYDLVILDFFLPDQIGDDVCRAVRKGGLIHLPILVVTGFSSRAEASFIESGANDVLFKPINHDDLLSKVQKYLGNT